MQLVEEIKKGIPQFTITSYGTDDLSTYYSLSVLLNNNEILEALVKQVPQNIDTIDDYLLYLFLEKCMDLSTYSNEISDASKRRNFENSLKKLKTINRLRLKQQALSFINNNVSKIWNLNRDIQTATLALIEENQKEISKEVCFKLATINPYYFLDNFTKFKVSFNKNPKFLEQVLDVSKYLTNNGDNLHEILNLYLEIISNREKKNEKLRKIVLKNTNIVYKRIENLSKSSWTYMQALVWFDNIKKVYQIFSISQNIEAYNVKQILSNVENTLDEGLKKKGKEVKIKVATQDEIDKFLKSFLNQPNLLSLTHCTKEGERKSYFEFVSSKKQLSDYFNNVGIETDDNYPATYQINLQNFMYFEVIIIKEIIFNSKRCNAFIDKFLYTVKYVSDKIENKQIFEHAQMLITNLKMIPDNINQDTIKDKIFTQTLSYNVITLTLGLIEELLREYSVFLLKDIKYVPREYITLGQLLTPSEDKIEGFNTKHKLGLAYFLAKPRHEKISLNIRNHVAHLYDEKDDLFTLFNVYKTLYLLLDVLNTISLTVFHNDKK